MSVFDKLVKSPNLERDFFLGMFLNKNIHPKYRAFQDDFYFFAIDKNNTRNPSRYIKSNI